jgi:hypothetical protein
VANWRCEICGNRTPAGHLDAAECQQCGCWQWVSDDDAPALVDPKATGGPRVDVIDDGRGFCGASCAVGFFGAMTLFLIGSGFLYLFKR